MNELVQTIKRAALDAVEAGEPSVPVLGTVAAVSPLEIRLHQRLTLRAGQLVLMEGLADLRVGERVALIRFAGGQRYLVLGRIL